MAIPPLPANSLDDFLNQEENDLADISSLLSRKRGRDGGDAARSSAPPQRRHSSRNMAIGSGFSNMPNAPVDLIDEEEDDIATKTDKEDASAVDPLAVLSGPLFSFLP